MTEVARGRRVWYPVLCALAFACSIAAVAAQPITPDQQKSRPATIRANPNPVPDTGSPGSTTISWSTGDDTEGAVRVSAGGGPERLFAEGPDGSITANWIAANETYEFRLYSKATRLLLATVNVRVGEPVSASTPLAPPAQSSRVSAVLVLLVALSLVGLLARSLKRRGSSIESAGSDAPLFSTREDWLWFLCGSVVVALAWSKLAWADVTLLAHHDAAEQTWPWWLYNVTEIQQGRLPLWNPFANGGQSHIGEGQAFALYPPMILAAWLGRGWARTTGAVHTMAFLHALLAFGGAYFMGRAARLRPSAATLCGLVFALGGFFTARAPHQLNIFMATAWAPLVLAGALMTVSTRRSGWMLLSGFAIAMSLLAGHAQPAYHAGFAACLAILVAGLLPLFSGPVLGVRRTTIAIGVMGASAAVLGAAQLWPMFEYQKLALRWVGGDTPVSAAAPVTFETMASNATLHLNEIPSFIYQHLDKVPDEASFYVGGCAAILALIGAVASTNRSRWIWIGLAAIGFLIALGTQTPVLNASTYLPFNRNRSPIRWLLVSHLAISLLAGIGLEALAESTTRRRQQIVVAAGVTFLAWSGWSAWPWLSPGGGMFALVLGLSAGVIAVAVLAIRPLKAARAAPALIVAVVAMELGTGMSQVFLPGRADGWLDVREYYSADVITRITGFLRSQAGHFRFAIWSAPAPDNLGVAIRVPGVNGFGATRPRLVHELQRDLPSVGWDLMGVRYVVIGTGSTPPDRSDLREVADFGDARVLLNPKALPLAWLVGSARIVDSESAALAAVSSEGFDARTTAVVVRGDAGTAGALGGLVEGHVEIAEYVPGRITMQVTCGGRALLVTSEADFPGWETRVDGMVTRHINVNYGFRGVALEKGAHTVDMRYRPRSVYGGIWISLSASAVILAVMVGAFRRRRGVTDRSPASAI